eukprot:PhM_4_TR17304/c0_g2_i1/m.12738
MFSSQWRTRLLMQVRTRGGRGGHGHRPFRHTGEDGGGSRGVPLAYSKFKKQPYMRRDHPNSRTANPESRSVPLSDSALGGDKKANDIPVVNEQRAIRRKQRQSLSEDVLWTGTVLRKTDSPFIQHLSKLRTNPKYRTSQNRMTVTGRKVIEELAQKQRIYPQTLILLKSKADPDLGKGYTGDTEIIRAEEWVMQAADPGNDGYIAEYDLPAPAPKELLFASPRKMQQIMVLDNVTDPSLVGTLMRTASAFAYDAVVLTNHCADLYDERTVRAARGVHFQTLTQFIVLREEDGDDTMELVNQTVEHHEVRPLVYSPHNTSEGVPLHDVLLNDSYTLHKDPKTNTHRQIGHMVVLGEDPTHTLLKKYDTRLRSRPTALLLEENVEEGLPLMLAAPSILYGLRHTGAWDMIPAGMETEDYATVQKESMGTMGYALPEPNLVGEEDVRDHFEGQSFEKMQRRYRRYRVSDQERWEEAERKRIHREALKEHQKMTSPWETPAPEEDGVVASSTHDPRYPDAVKDRPNLYTREDVREQVQQQIEYRMPTQYSKYMRPGYAGPFKTKK